MRPLILKCRTECSRQQCLLESERACEFSLGAAGDWLPLGFTGSEVAVVEYDGEVWSIRAVRGFLSVNGTLVLRRLRLESPAVISFGSAFLIVDDELESGAETVRLQSLLKASLVRRANAKIGPTRLSAPARAPSPPSRGVRLRSAPSVATADGLLFPVDDSHEPTLARRLEGPGAPRLDRKLPFTALESATFAVDSEPSTRPTLGALSKSERLGVWQDDLTEVFPLPRVRPTLANDSRVPKPVSEPEIELTQIVDAAALYHDLLLGRRAPPAQSSPVLEPSELTARYAARASTGKRPARPSVWAASLGVLLVGAGLFGAHRFTRDAQARSAESTPTVKVIAPVQSPEAIRSKETLAIQEPAVAGPVSAKLAADALIRGEMGQALAAYRALNRSEPNTPAYSLIADVLARRIARERKR